MVNRTPFNIILSISVILCVPGCTAPKDTLHSFTEIDFPDVKEQVYAHDFETKNIFDLFSTCTTVDAPFDYYFYSNGVLHNSTLYGTSKRLNNIHYGDLAYLDLKTGKSEVLVETPYGKYSSIIPFTDLDDNIICRATGYAPYEFEFFAYNTKTKEKESIVHVNDMPYAIATADEERVMYSIPMYNYPDNPDNAAVAVFKWEPGNNKPVKVADNGSSPFKVGNEWYCITFFQEKPEESTLARIDGNKLTEIKLNNIYGVIWEACAFDDTHILICSSPQSFSELYRIYVYDLTTKQATYLFDVKGGAESLEVHDQFVSWYGYPRDNMEEDKMTILYDYKNKIRYLSDFHTIVMSDEGVAFNSLDKEYEELEYIDKLLHSKWHYARWSDVKSDDN